MRPRRPTKTTLALCALLPVLILAGGCGGDDDGGSGGLSGRDKLEVLQARGDIG